MIPDSWTSNEAPPQTDEAWYTGFRHSDSSALQEVASITDGHMTFALGEVYWLSAI
jgi:hypothetical protein